MTDLEELISAYVARPVTAGRSPVDLARHITGGAYLVPRHIALINEKLLAVARGEITRLVITAPPRHGKSWLISKYFPPWYLGKFPDRRVILTSYEATFAERWGLAAKEILEEHGRTIFGVRLNPDSSAAARWDLLGHEGGMNAVGAGGPLTGKGANILVLEDIIKSPQEANSQVQRDSLWSWFQGAAYTRLEPGGAIIASGTRWHEDDVLGRILQSEEQWEELRLPAIAEEEDALGRIPGAALWPERFSVEDLTRIKAQIGSYAWAALYQQSPVPAGGRIIQRSWFRYWQTRGSSLRPLSALNANGERVTHNPVDLPERFDVIVQSWDLSFKDKATSDFVVGQVWGCLNADRFLLDQRRERMDFPKTIKAFSEMSEKWPGASYKFVEAKANGEALLSSLQHEISGLIPVNPSIDKVSRVHAISAQIESGNVYVPHPDHAPWSESFINECISFPSGKFDDQVDAMSQALAQTLERCAPLRFYAL